MTKDANCVDIVNSAKYSGYRGLSQIMIVTIVFSCLCYLTEAAAMDNERNNILDQDTKTALADTIDRRCSKGDCCDDNIGELIDKDLSNEILRNGTVVMTIIQKQSPLVMHQNSVTVVEYRASLAAEYYLVCKSGFGLANTRIVGKLLTVKYK